MQFLNTGGFHCQLSKKKQKYVQCLAVNGALHPFVSEQCAYYIDSQSEEHTLFIYSSAPCFTSRVSFPILTGLPNCLLAIISATLLLIFFPPHRMVSSLSLYLVIMNTFSPAQSLLGSPMHPLHLGLHLCLPTTLSIPTSQIPLDLPLLHLQPQNTENFRAILTTAILVSSSPSCPSSSSSTLLGHKPKSHLSPPVTVLPVTSPIFLGSHLILLAP